jgi:hypothetical protein
MSKKSTENLCSFSAQDVGNLGFRVLGFWGLIIVMKYHTSKKDIIIYYANELLKFFFGLEIFLELPNFHFCT